MLDGLRGTGAANDPEMQSFECWRHIDLIIELCDDIKITCEQDGRKVFEKITS